MKWYIVYTVAFYVLCGCNKKNETPPPPPKTVDEYCVLQEKVLKIRQEREGAKFDMKIELLNKRKFYHGLDDSGKRDAYSCAEKELEGYE